MLVLRLRIRVHPDNREPMVSLGDVVASGGRGMRMVLLRDDAGPYRPVHFAAAALPDRTGATVGRVAR